MNKAYTGFLHLTIAHEQKSTKEEKDISCNSAAMSDGTTPISRADCSSDPPKRLDSTSSIRVESAYSSPSAPSTNSEELARSDPSSDLIPLLRPHIDFECVVPICQRPGCGNLVVYDCPLCIQSHVPAASACSLGYLYIICS